jgi:hypothetical protein
MSSNYYSSLESERYQEWIIETLAKGFGMDTTDKSNLLERLEKAVYKGTDCGAWVRVIEDETVHLVVGTIVEGSDAEYTEEVNLEGCDRGDEEELCRRFWAAMDNCEKFAEEHFDYDNNTL